MHPNFHSSTIYNNKNMGATSVSINWWLDKEDIICLYNVILLNYKKMKFCHLQGHRFGGHYAKWNKSEKDKYCMISLICGIQKDEVGEYNKKQI